MNHSVFGKLAYKEGDGCWIGRASLGRFAASGAMAPAPPLTEENSQQVIAEMNLALENMRGLMREKFGNSADAVFAEIDKQLEDGTAEAIVNEPPDPAEEERERKQLARAAKKAKRLAKGVFAIRIGDPDASGTTPQQHAAYQYLIENEAAIYDAVLQQIWESFQSAYGQEYWRKMANIKPATSIEELRGRFGIVRVEIAYEYRGDFAYLVFPIESDWQDEHGLFIVYSPDRGETQWSSFDGLDELLGAESELDELDEEYVPTPHEELVEAVMTGDEALANELVAAGADINDLGPDEVPPLCVAAEQMDVDEVRRLLAFGADPNLDDPVTLKTPLRIAKGIYRKMGFAPSKKKKDALRDALMALAQEAAGSKVAAMKERLEEIVRLLEEAGGK